MFPCLSVKASDFAEQLGMEQGEFDSILDEDKTLQFDIPFVYAEETGNYTIQEDIKLNSSGVSFYWEHKPYINNVSYGSSVLSFGTVKTVTNIALSLTMTLYNDNKLLFNQSGTLYLKLVAYSTKGTLRLTRVGDYVTEIGIATDPSDINAFIELEIPNTLADLVKVEIILDGPVKQGTGDNYLAGGIVKYGYTLHTSVSGSDSSKSIFDLLKGFVSSFWQNTMGSIANVFSFLSNFVSNFWNSFSEKIGALFRFLEDFVKGFWSALSVSLETAYDYLTEKVSVLFQYFKDFILEFWSDLGESLRSAYDYLTEKISELFQYFKDFILSFWNTFVEKLESGFDYLTNKIYGLFLPPKDYIKNWLNSYYLQFKDKMGVFGYIHDYTINLINLFYSVDYGEPILTFPRMTLTIPNYDTYTICEAQKINLNDLVKDIPSAVDALHFGTSVIMTFWLVSYSRKVFNDILK